MTSRDRLIALLKPMGIGGAMIASLIAGLLWEECPPDSSGPVTVWTSDTSFQVKAKTGERSYAFVRAFNADGMVSEPAGPVQLYASSTRIHFWTDAESLLCWWPPHEGSGSRAVDLIGGVVAQIDGATWASGPEEFALRFDGIDDKLYVGPMDIARLPLRIEARVNLDPGINPATSGGARIVDKSNATINYWQMTLYQGIAQSDSFQVRLRVRTSQGLGTLITSKYWIKVGHWVHLAGEYDGAMMRVYVDGKLANAMPWTGALVSAPAVPVYIGWGGHGGQGFKGSIAEVKIARRVQ